MTRPDDVPYSHLKRFVRPTRMECWDTADTAVTGKPCPGPTPSAPIRRDHRRKMSATLNIGVGSEGKKMGMVELPMEIRGATGGPLDLEQFLVRSSDKELLNFFRYLPMVAGQDELLTIQDLIYELNLRPFLETAWREIEGTPGVPGRILQLMRVYRRAEDRFEKRHGRRRRRPRVIDLPSFLDVYGTEGIGPS